MVVSSCLCKLPKDTLTPFQAKPVKDGENNPLDTLCTHETDHGPRPPTHFHGTAFDHIRRPQLAPERSWTLDNSGRSRSNRDTSCGYVFRLGPAHRRAPLNRLRSLWTQQH